VAVTVTDGEGAGAVVNRQLMAVLGVCHAPTFFVWLPGSSTLRRGIFAVLKSVFESVEEGGEAVVELFGGDEAFYLGLQLHRVGELVGGEVGVERL